MGDLVLRCGESVLLVVGLFVGVVRFYVFLELGDFGEKGFF